MRPLLLVGRIDETETGEPAARRFALPYHWAKLVRTSLTPMPGGRRRDSGECRRGWSGRSAPSLQKRTGSNLTETRSGSPANATRPGSWAKASTQRRRPGLDGRPAEPGDREMEIDLVVRGEQVPQAVRVPEEVREVLRPEDDRVDLGRGQVDLHGAAPRADEPGPAGPRRAAASHSGKEATRSVRREALITVFRGLFPRPEEPVAQRLAEEELEQEEVEEDEDAIEQEHGPGHRAQDLEERLVHRVRGQPEGDEPKDADEEDIEDLGLEEDREAEGRMRLGLFELRRRLGVAAPGFADGQDRRPGGADGLRLRGSGLPGLVLGLLPLPRRAPPPSRPARTGEGPG